MLTVLLDDRQHLRFEEESVIIDNDGKMLNLHLDRCTIEILAEAARKGGAVVLVFPHWKAKDEDIIGKNVIEGSLDEGSDMIIQATTRNARCEIIAPDATTIVAQEMTSLLNETVKATVKVDKGTFTITASSSNGTEAFWTADKAVGFECNYEGLPAAEHWCFA